MTSRRCHLKGWGFLAEKCRAYSPSAYRISPMQMRDMTEEENQNVEEVVQPSEPETVPESIAKEPQKGSAEYNFREARKLMQEQSRRIQELEAREYQRQQAMQAEPVDELAGLGQEDYLTRKQAEALAIRKAQELMAQQEQATAEDRARLKYRDYDDVVTDDNIDELIKDDPEVADLIRSSQNPHATAYKLIKKTASFQEKSKKKPAHETEKIIKNTQKPVSSNAVQARPLAQANSYAFSSEEEKRQLYNEMMGYANRR